MILHSLFAAVSLAPLAPMDRGLPAPEDRAVAKAADIVPRWDGNDIVAGSKRLSVQLNSQLTLTEGGKTLFTMQYGCRAESRTTGKTYWPGPCYRFREGGGRMFRDGNAIVHERPYRLEDFAWNDAFRQRVELLPDGLVAIEAAWTDPDVTNFAFRSIGAVFAVPYETAKGSRFSVNGGESEAMPDSPRSGGRSWKTRGGGAPGYVLFEGDAARQFKIVSRPGETGGEARLFSVARGNEFRITEKRDGRRHGYRILLDLRRGVEAQAGAEVRGGVDFRRTENLAMPRTGTRNLLVNPSFERGLTGLYRSVDVGTGHFPEKWDLPVWTADASERVHGARSLRILAWNRAGTDLRNLATTGGIALHPVVADPGRYALSFYAKCDRPGDIRLSAWIGNFSTGSPYAEIPGGKIKTYPADSWRRYVLKTEIPVSMPVVIHLSANSYSGPPGGKVWVDAVQFEKGDEATPFAPPPAEAELLTSSADDFVEAGTPVRARLAVSAAPGAKGVARVQVRDFFGETRFDGSFPFVADRSGHAEIAPDFDSVPLGLGVFAVETGYTLDDGSSAREFDRFAVCDFLDGTHPRRFLCSDDYGPLGQEENIRHQLDRWRKVGFGMKSVEPGTPRGDAFALYASNGIPVCAAHVPSRYTDAGGVKRWCYRLRTATAVDPKNEAAADDVLFADPVLDPDCPDGVPTEKYLAKVRSGAARLAREYPFVERWQFGSEFFGSYATEYWSPDGVAANAFMNFARILKAFGEGIKSVCPEKPYAGDDPWNLNPGQGIAEIEGILSAANALGWRFDRVSAHSYRNRPESPDLDADLSLTRAMLARLGYADVPFDLSEGMHWGPYEIPQWGTLSASWGTTPATWCGGALSYDIGWTEKVSAAWFARSWIMALRHNVHSACAGLMRNFAIEHDRLTPRAAQLAPNVIGHQLGHAAAFLADARFAPFVRAYVFDDGFGRPVAAVWGCDPEVDAGRKAPPVAEVDMRGTLERVTDFMNNPRPFPQHGAFAFPVSPFPLFLRGKKDSETAFIEAVGKARLVAGGAAAVTLGASLRDECTVRICARNLLGRPLRGRLDGEDVALGALAEATREVPLPEAVSPDCVRTVELPLAFESPECAGVRRKVTFGATVAKKTSYAGKDPLRIDWSKHPALPLKTWGETPAGYGGAAQLAWNDDGLFVRVAVRDAKFVHEEFTAEARRNANDCLQIGFDGYGDARLGGPDSPGHDDYEYAVFPAADGKEAVFWANRVADRQITGNTKEHGNCRIPDVKPAFARTEDGFEYLVFVPRSRIYPGNIRAGSTVSLGLTVFNADDPAAADGDRVRGGLSFTGENAVGRPALWIEAVLHAAGPPPPPAREEWGFMKDLARREPYTSHWTRAAKPGELDLSKGVKVIDGYGVEGGLKTATDDLDAFLADVKLAGGGTPLSLVRRDCGAKEAYALEVSRDGVALVAGDDDGMRRAIYFFEDRLLGSEAAALAFGRTARRPWVRNRISRCFFGPIKRPPFNRDELTDDIDYYPDAYLNRLAHEGVNGLWLTVEFRDIARTSFMTPSPDAERRLAKLRRTVEKCRRYGIGTWLFCIEPRILEDTPELGRRHPEIVGVRHGGGTVACTSAESARRYLEEAAESIFRDVPGLAGLINISHGERPTTCLSRISPVPVGDYAGSSHKSGCPRCDAIPPWQIHLNTITAMLAGMRRANPDAEIISWFYHPQVRPERSRWVYDVARHVPSGVTLAYNFESGALKEQLGRMRTGGDYWLSFTGPSMPFERVAEAAAQAGSALGAKIQVGCSHEVATVPFVPVPGLLYRKYAAMKRAGVSTVLQCWYFGNCPGVMNKAAGELSFDDFSEDEDAFLERLARPEWGTDAPHVAKLWRSLSDAYADYPLSNDMQYYGPFHAGVVWPLYADVRLEPLGRTWKPEDAPGGDMIGEALENHTLDEAVALSDRMSAGARAAGPDGKSAYTALAAKYAGNRPRLLDIGVMNALALQFESGRDIFRFYRERSEAIDRSRVRGDHAGARNCLSRMKALVRREQEISREMRALAAADSRLGFHSEAEMHQYYPARLAWRIGELDATLKEIDRIDAALARGEPYPESEFERRAPACRVGGGWTHGRGLEFRLEETGEGDLIVTVKTKAPSATINTFDAAGVQWQRGVTVGSDGRVESPVCGNVVTQGHVATCAVAEEGGGRVYTIALSAAGWSRETRLRPGWIQVTTADGGIWPDLPRPAYRLNLGNVRGDVCGRILR